jgi:hypothetical protein
MMLHVTARSGRWCFARRGRRSVHGMSMYAAMNLILVRYDRRRRDFYRLYTQEHYSTCPTSTSRAMAALDAPWYALRGPRTFCSQSSAGLFCKASANEMRIRVMVRNCACGY